ncbi:hypothetical protein ROZALSC1DRAFT_25346, partial [Rozella allomycis CSF55]
DASTNVNHEISNLPVSHSPILCSSSPPSSDLDEVMLIDLPCSISNSSSISNSNLFNNQTLPYQVDVSTPKSISKLSSSSKFMKNVESISVRKSMLKSAKLSKSMTKMDILLSNRSHSLFEPNGMDLPDCIQPLSKTTDIETQNQSMTLSDFPHSMDLPSNNSREAYSGPYEDGSTDRLMLTNLESSMSPLAPKSDSKSIVKWGLPIKHCNQSFSEYVDAGFQDQSTIMNLDNPIAPLEHSYHLKSKSGLKLPLNNSSQSVSEVFQNQAMFTNLEISREESEYNIKSQKTVKMGKEKEYIYFDTSAENASPPFNVGEQTHPPESIPTSTPMNELKNIQSILDQTFRESVQKDHSSSDFNNVRSQDESILTSLGNFIGPLEYPSVSTSKLKTDMDLPLQNDVLFQNQPVLSNLGDFMAPLEHLSISISKTKSKIDIPLENDALFENRDELTNLEIFMDPLQHPLHSKETLLNLVQSKLISKRNLPVVDCSQTSSFVQNQNQSISLNLEKSIVPVEHSSSSTSKLRLEMDQSKLISKMNLPLVKCSQTFSEAKDDKSIHIISLSKVNPPLNDEVPFQNQPVLPNLETSMDPLQLSS